MRTREIPDGPRRSPATRGNDRTQHWALPAGVLLAALLWLVGPTAVHAADCNRPTPSALVHVTLPGSPFTALPSADGCWLFVSLAGETPGASSGVAVLERADGVVTVKRTLSFPGSPAGMVLTHDGAVLIVANGANVVFLDVRRLTSGAARPVLGYWGSEQLWPMSIYVSVTTDDRYLLVSNEALGTISVIDLAQTRRAHFAQVQVVGAIAVGNAPVGLALSSDERFLFATVQSVDAMGWSNRCKPERDPAGAADHAEGAIAVVDMKLATSDPGRSLLRRVPAGCNPVRVVVSGETGRVYVTARGSDELLSFTERELSGSGPDPRATRVAVGTSPVGLAVIDKGRKLVVASSNRFNAGTSPAELYVVDATGISSNSTPLLGTMPSRAFPREIRATADGRTLLVTNFSAGTVQIVDLGRTPWDFGLNNGRHSNDFPGPPFTAALTLRPRVYEQCRRTVEGLTNASAALSLVTLGEPQDVGLIM
jgi:DNA-binding beta-propeller fold protein YncE